jgi:membrane-associated phospholipid phosphatase
METINALGIQLVLFIQGWGAWLEAPMRFFSFLGTEDFFLLVLPVLYWSVDSSLGMRVGFILLFNQALNGLFKVALAGPRPYWMSDKVLPLASESSFGLPSGHAESAAGVWGIMGAYINKAWSWALAILIIFLIGLSRVYLAVHFPLDVLLGWLIGGLTLWLFIARWNRTAAWLKRQSTGLQVGLSFLVSMLMIVLDYLIVLSRSAYVLDPAWSTNILRIDEALPQPFAISGLVTVAGMFFGLGLGLAWMERGGGFHASGPLMTRALCYLVGLVGILVFWYGLGAVLPRGETVLPLVLRYLRYTLVGFWVTGGAPWLFARLGLVGAAPAKPQEALPA